MSKNKHTGANNTTHLWIFNSELLTQITLYTIPHCVGDNARPY